MAALRGRPHSSAPRVTGCDPAVKRCGEVSFVTGTCYPRRRVTIALKVLNTCLKLTQFHTELHIIIHKKKKKKKQQV